MGVFINKIAEKDIEILDIMKDILSTLNYPYEIHETKFQDHVIIQIDFEDELENQVRQNKFLEEMEKRKIGIGASLWKE